MRLGLLIPSSLLLALGCSRTVEQPPTFVPTPRAQLARLEAPASVKVGAPLSLTVRVLGDSTGQRLQLRARAPGARALPGEGSFLTSSTALATSALQYVQADSSLAATPAALLTAPADGATLGLSLPTPGQWSFIAELVDAAGEVESAAPATVLVSDAPALSLVLNRLVAGSDDPLVAKLTLASGGATAPVKLLAWLQDAAGRAQFLPGLDGAVPVLYRGPAADRTFTLLGRPLPVGRWELHALLYDASDRLISFTSAGVDVCDTPSALSGTVTITDSPAPASGEVALLDLDDQRAISIPVQSGGVFSASVPPGRYIATARLPGRRPASAAVTLGCGGAATLALKVAADLLPGQALSGTSTRQALGDGVDGPRVLVTATSETLAVSPGRAELCAGAIAAALTPQAEAWDPTALQGLALQSATAQAVGGPDYGLDAIAGALSADVVGAFTIRDASKTKLSVTFELSDVRATTMLWVWTRLIDPNDPNDLQAAVEALLHELETSAEVSNALQSAADLPRHPALRIGGPTRVHTGTTFPFIAQLTDKVVHQGFPGKTITLAYTDVTGAPRTAEAVTDADGVARFTLEAGAAPGTLRIEGTYTRGHGQQYSAGAVVEVVDPDDVVRVTTTTPLLSAGETAALSVALDGVTGGMTDSVDVSASGGSLDAPRLTTDVHGVAADGFTADGTRSTALVSATARGHTGSLELVVRPACHDGVCPDLGPDAPTRLILSVDPTDLVTDGMPAFVVADLRVARNQFADIPLSASVTGLGTVDPAPVVTDANGLARIRYLAPSTGQGTDTVTVTARVAGGLVRASIELHYQPPCASCPLVITGPDFVKKGGTAQFTANLPARWAIAPALASVSTSGKVTAGLAGGKAVLTATTVELPTRTATRDVWVTCTPDEVKGTYVATLAYDLDTPSFDSTCPRATQGTLVIGPSPGGQPNQLSLDLRWPNGVPNGTCGYNPSNPQFATLGDACDVTYAAAADFSSNNCAYLRYRLERATANVLTGRFDVKDLQNACTPALGVTVRATK